MPFDKSQYPIKRIAANSIDFAYISAGEGPLVLCLHGFPDTAYTFHELLPALAKAGFHAVAPFSRGYAPTSCAVDNDYRIATLGKDVSALITALGYSSASLIGHDWGALTCYAAVNIAPHKIDSIITAAVPHAGSIRPNPKQLRRSWYMAFFQLRFFAELAVRHNNFAFIERLWRDWSPGWKADRALMSEVKAALSNRKSLRAALGYYRAMLSNPFNAGNKASYRLMRSSVSVPTLTFAGENDGCVGVEMFRNMQHFIDAPFRFRPIHGAGHFMHLEKPDIFISETVRFLVGETETISY